MRLLASQSSAYDNEDIMIYANFLNFPLMGVTEKK